MAGETKELNLNISPQQIHLVAQQALRRAAVFMAIGLSAAKDDSLASLKLDPDFPIEFLPHPPSPELLLNARIHFGQWVIGSGLRELTHGFALFLDRLYEALLIVKYHGTKVPGRELQHQMKLMLDEGRLIEKLVRIETSFGLSAKFKDCFPAISLARDALAYNIGVIRARDCNEDQTLRLKWIGLKSEHRERCFTAGERIDLSAYELSEICWTFGKQADELIDQLMLAAQFKGIRNDATKG